MSEPLLEIDSIQGNVLPGFGSAAQLLVGVTGSPEGLRAFLADLAPRLASARDVLGGRRQVRAALAARLADPDRGATWFNVALSAAGLRKLGRPDLDAFDTAFKLGLAARSGTLGDPRQASIGGLPNPGHKSHWVVGGPGNEADVLVIVGADDEPARAEAETWLRAAADGRATISYAERGNARLENREHFGFRDDISHPGVRGLVETNPPSFLTTRHLAEQLPDGPEFGLPGQPLVWPGQFVLGYPTQSQVGHRDPGPVASNLPAWAVNGSFLVFRRLQQDVPGFVRDTDAMAADLAARPGWAGMTGARLRALIVGRWPSGVPVGRSPLADDPTIAADRFALNHFGYEKAVPPVRLGSGELVPSAPADPDGLLVPHFAHVRKVNPRDRDTDQGAAVVTLSLRLLRRGLPFGPDYDHDRADNPDNARPRGLLFLSYQASIQRQFEVIQAKWMNSASAPESVAGEDLLIGQRNGPGGDRTRTGFVVRPDLQGDPVPALQDWVLPTGGGYFFAPSIPAVREMAGLVPIRREAAMPQLGPSYTLRRVELKRRVDALPTELDEWKERTLEEVDKNAHFTQVQTIDALLRVSVDKQQAIVSSLAGAADAAEFTTKSFELIQMINRAQTVWDYFRDKFNLRLIPKFASDLWIADTIAWDCYFTVMTNAVIAGIVARDKFREPPLTFLITEFSPYTYKRGDALKLGKENVALPVPVIGLPCDHLPNPWEFVYLAHEVAHDLERDLDLLEPLKGALAGALAASQIPQARAWCWTAWLQEVFADLVALHLCGPAFSQGLATILSLPADKVLTPNPAGPHPTHYVRIPMNAAYLSRMAASVPALEADAKALRESWVAAYGDGGELAKFADDFTLVFDALMTTKIPVFQNQTVADLVPYAAADDTRIRDVADYIRTGNNNPGRVPPRFCVSASRLAVTAAASQNADPTGLLNDIKTRTETLVRAGAPDGLRSSGARPRLEEAAADLGL